MTDTTCNRPAVLDRRRFGILLHPSSLPGDGKKGDLGDNARRFVDFLAASGASVWQVLPLGPHGDDSPYNARSAYAGDPTLISLQDLSARGWLAPEEIASGPGGENACRQVLHAAYLRFLQGATPEERDELAAFELRQAAWLPDFALYECLKTVHRDTPWREWPKEVRDREPEALAAVRQSEAYGYYGFEQFVFFGQWQALRDYARARNVRFFGDMAIFVAEDSADVWAHKDLFILNAEGRPEIVTGVPPDYFSADGQRWGNPHYNWERMADDGFAWWRERVRTQRELFDWVRIDHFRGLDAVWAIPFAATTAVEGEWIPVPGNALLSALHEAFGDVPLIAEDLGMITESVYALRDRYGLPGMRVLQFAFDGTPENPHLPHNFVPNSVAYTGTHDNDTTLGWYGQLSDHERMIAHEYLGPFDGDVPWPFIRAVLASVSYFAIVPWQDVLALGSEARMNTPGKSAGNWGFRFDWNDVPHDLASRLRKLAAIFGRVPS
ncbi:MAG TPA: 4-alpha-glucanotransferase [Acidiferrobacter sp.]|nr:4-alpha-glucanotransferase [Acidiferrobacter sp.]